jgi:hypothetical protein
MPKKYLYLFADGQGQEVMKAEGHTLHEVVEAAFPHAFIMAHGADTVGGGHGFIQTVNKVTLGVTWSLIPPLTLLGTDLPLVKYSEIPKPNFMIQTSPAGPSFVIAVTDVYQFAGCNEMTEYYVKLRSNGADGYDGMTFDEGQQKQIEKLLEV